MDWLSIILVSYLILSVSNLVDKIFLSRIVTESIVYALWVNLLSVGLVALFLIHWTLDHDAYTTLKGLGEVTAMTPWFIMVALFIGVLFTLSTYLLYSALQNGEASRVIPLIGGSMPVLIYAMSAWYQPLANKQLIAFIILVLGTVLISWMPKGEQTTKSKKAIYLGLLASLCFAIFFVLSQYLFASQGFINGIIWPRVGSAGALIALFVYPGVFNKFRHSLEHLSLKMRAGWLANQALGAIGFIGQSYVISIPAVSVALVSALQSVQYAFILLFAAILSFIQPKLLRERISTSIIIQKAVAVICIGTGFYLIAL